MGTYQVSINVMLSAPSTDTRAEMRARENAAKHLYHHGQSVSLVAARNLHSTKRQQATTIQHLIRVVSLLHKQHEEKEGEGNPLAVYTHTHLGPWTCTLPSNDSKQNKLRTRTLKTSVKRLYCPDKDSSHLKEIQEL